MRFAIRVLRYRGRVIPWRDVVNRSPKIGDIRIEELRDEDLRRYVRTAKLFPDDGTVVFRRSAAGTARRPGNRHEPAGIHAGGPRRIGGTDYAQSWLISAL